MTRGAISAADVAREIQESSKYTITAQMQSVNFPELVTYVEKTVDGDSESVVKAYQKPGINKQLFQGTAKFIGPRTVQVGRGCDDCKKTIL